MGQDGWFCKITALFNLSHIGALHVCSRAPGVVHTSSSMDTMAQRFQ